MMLAIDMSNIYHRSYAIVNNYKGFDITQEKWQLTLGRKFITDILSLIKRFNPNDVVFAFDSQNYFRKDIYPEYKGNRSKKEQEFYDVINEIYDIIKNKGLNAFKIDGLEADDLLAFESENFEFTVLVTNDEDVRQCVNKSTVVYTANSQNNKLYCISTKQVAKYIPNFVNISTIIDPQFIWFKKILLGDAGDNVKRLLPKGNGIKKVEKMYNNFLQHQDINLTLRNFDFDIKSKDVLFQMQLVDLKCQPSMLANKYYSKILSNIEIEKDTVSFLKGSRYVK